MAHSFETSVRKSLPSPTHIISMTDGKKHKTLRRRLSTNGLIPDEYRQRYNLNPEYPMVATTYSEARRAITKMIGLGCKPCTKVEEAAEGATRSVCKGGKAVLAAARKILGTANQAPAAATARLIASAVAGAQRRLRPAIVACLPRYLVTSF